MLAFLYLLYLIIALFYETIPVFEDTWAECLREISLYRLALRDKDIRDGEVWACNAYNWYLKVSDRALTTSRLHHHRANSCKT
jgi:hypothetical protein